jgi:5-methylcytosine-specific restriction endonuclease McrBC GTP-binding regulatory subunit McrB
MPDPSKLRGKRLEGIDLEHLLSVINQRIELLVDRDHTIGHSYFINIDDTLQLANAFNDRVVPLLQEYFYGDFGKIGLVLGKGFVQKNENNKVDFAEFSYENQEDFKNDTYTLVKATQDTIVESLKILLGEKSPDQEAQTD